MQILLQRLKRFIFSVYFFNRRVRLEERHSLFIFLTFHTPKNHSELVILLEGFKFNVIFFFTLDSLPCDQVSRGVLNIWSRHSSFFARVIIILKVRFKDCVKTRNQNVHRKKNKMSCKSIANLFLPLLTLANLAVYINYNN